MQPPPRTLLRYLLALILMIGGCALAVATQADWRSAQAVGLADLVGQERNSDRIEKIRLSPAYCTQERFISIKKASSQPLASPGRGDAAARLDGACRLLQAGRVATRFHFRPVETFSARAPPQA